MTEAELRAWVLDECQDRGLLVHYCRDMRRCLGTGLPDLLIVGRRVIFRELKVTGGRLEPEQARWYWKLKAARADVAIWRPSQRELIEAELDAIRQPATRPAA